MVGKAVAFDCLILSQIGFVLSKLCWFTMFGSSQGALRQFHGVQRRPGEGLEGLEDQTRPTYETLRACRPLGYKLKPLRAPSIPEGYLGAPRRS